MQAKLEPIEYVQLNNSRLMELYQRLGATTAENIISHAMEDLAVCLSNIARALQNGDLESVEKTARKISMVSLQVGMPALKRVADDVAGLCGAQDGPAISATMARLARLGEQSLMAVWEIEGVSG